MRKKPCYPLAQKSEKTPSQRAYRNPIVPSSLPKLVEPPDSNQKQRLGSLELQITDLSHDGRGITKLDDGKVVFVSGALPSETVVAKIRQHKQNFAEATLVKLITTSKERVTPICNNAGRCGGCQLQHLSYSGQVNAKQQQFKQALERKKIATSDIVAPILSTPFHYRRRARWVLNAQHQLCFRSLGGKEQIAISDCALLELELNQLIKNIQLAITQKQLSANAMIELELIAFDQRVIVIKVTRHWHDAQQQKWQHWLIEQGIDLLVVQQADQSTVIALSSTLETELTEQVNQDKLSVSWNSFVQANRLINQQMVHQAIDWLMPTKETKILDLFCGIGNFSFALAQTGAEVLGIENNPASLYVAKQTAQRLILKNIQFLSADLFDSNTQLPTGYQSILLDPPWDGADQVCQKLKKRKDIQRILYISCHQGSLIRDLETLTSAGFKIIKTGLIDQFPQTYHIESMTLLMR
mgnify:CR=1 FL=1